MLCSTQSIRPIFRHGRVKRPRRIQLQEHKSGELDGPWNERKNPRTRHEKTIRQTEGNVIRLHIEANGAVDENQEASAKAETIRLERPALQENPRSDLYRRGTQTWIGMEL